MKHLKIFLLVCFTLILTNSAFSQGKFLGKVIEVIDGKTVVIELMTGKLTAVLQYIEIPEPEQPLSREVKNHLIKLTLGKTVEFKPLRVTMKSTVGQMMLDGVDISNQMLRDGAAWYALPEMKGQSEFDRRTYQDNEKQARAEKRGVWSIENLKPAWEVRAEAEERRKQQEERAKTEGARLEQFGAGMRPQKVVVRRELSSESQKLAASGTSIQLPPNIQNIGGLLVGYDKEKNVGIVATPMFRMEFPEADGDQVTTIQMAYLYYNGDMQTAKRSVYIVGIDSESRDFKFLKYNELVLTADGRKINLGKAKRMQRRGENSVQEALAYEIKKPVLEKIANSRNVTVKVGNFSSKVRPEMLEFLKGLLNTSE